MGEGEGEGEGGDECCNNTLKRLPTNECPLRIFSFQLKAHRRGAVTAIQFSSNGYSVATGGADNIVKLFDVGSGKRLSTIGGHSKEVTCVAFTADDEFIISGSLDCSVRYAALV